MLVANQIATFLYQLYKVFLTNCFCHCKHVSLSSLTKAEKMILKSYEAAIERSCTRVLFCI